ncbi:MAG: type II toxin-antitoxin system HicA family toxin [Anaerolineales bacterium]|nr:type II toxin-antitoxin system HicA family toxin [Anaerolineales bacterium]
MSGLRLLAYRDLARVAEMAGFRWKRCRASHNTFQSDDGRVVVIPDHGNQVIVRPLLRKIIRDMGLTVEQYNRLTEKL